LTDDLLSNRDITSPETTNLSKPQELVDDLFYSFLVSPIHFAYSVLDIPTDCDAFAVLTPTARLRPRSEISRPALADVVVFDQAA
jgi:hypothetical protein